MKLSQQGPSLSELTKFWASLKTQPLTDELLDKCIEVWFTTKERVSDNEVRGLSFRERMRNAIERSYNIGDN